MQIALCIHVDTVQIQIRYRNFMLSIDFVCSQHINPLNLPIIHKLLCEWHMSCCVNTTINHIKCGNNTTVVFLSHNSFAVWGSLELDTLLNIFNRVLSHSFLLSVFIFSFFILPSSFCVVCVCVYVDAHMCCCLICYMYMYMYASQLPFSHHCSHEAHMYVGNKTDSYGAYVEDLCIRGIFGRAHTHVYI